MSRFVEQDKRTITIPGKQDQIVRTWEGPLLEPDGSTAADVGEFLSAELPAGYIQLQRTDMKGGQWGRFEATYNDDSEVPTEDAGLIERTWNRDVNYEEKSILLCPNAVAMMTAPTGSGDDTKEEFAQWGAAIVASADRYRTAVRKFVAGEISERPTPSSFWTKLAQFQPSAATSDQIGLARKLWQVCLKLPDATVDVSYPVLRKTETVTSETVLKVSSLHTNRFWSRAALEAAEPTLPSVALIDWAGLSDYVWLKKDPEVATVNGGLLQLTQEYWGALEFEDFLFGDLIT